MPGTIPEVRVAVESTAKRAFATALDWPGWSRGGKTPGAAVEALALCASRYAVVAGAAAIEFDTTAGLRVVMEVPGNASTEFGVPGAEYDVDLAPVPPAELRRTIALVEAAWQCFDLAVQSAPAELRKGPRGGGRDRDKIAAHVAEAEGAYSGALGLKLAPPNHADEVGVKAHRELLLEALRRIGSRPAPEPGAKPKRWSFRYAARRIAWHALDHTWEIEDRSAADGLT